MELAKRIQGRSARVVKDLFDNERIMEKLIVARKIRGFALLWGLEYLEPAQEARQQYFVRNDQYGFELRRRTSADKWALAQFFEDIGDGTGVRLSVFLNDNTIRTFAPFEVFAKWLPEISTHKEFVVKSQKRVKEHGKDLVRIDFDYSLPQKQYSVRSGWFLLDPSLYWLVKAYRANVIWGKSDAGTVDYVSDFTLDSDGVPLLTKALEKIDCPSQKVRVDRVTEYSLERREAAAEEFALSAFGLPDVRKGSGTSWTRPLILAGAGFLCLALGIKIWFRRRKPAEASPPRQSEMGLR
jgi:hypothetical protein